SPYPHCPSLTPPPPTSPLFPYTTLFRSDTTLRRRPGLASYLRRQVVIGIRPEDFVDAADANAPPDARLRVPVSRSETVGADTFVQFVMDSPLLLAEDPRTADVEERVDESWPAERPNVWMARRRAD